MTDGVRVADYLTDASTTTWYLRISKAEQRRTKRGVTFPNGERCRDPWQIHINRDKVYVSLSDGSYWRCFVRGGKTFRRRLKAPCLTISKRPPIDLRAFYGVGVSAETLENAQNEALANILKLTNEALAKP